MHMTKWFSFVEFVELDQNSHFKMWFTYLFLSFAVLGAAVVPTYHQPSLPAWASCLDRITRCLLARIYIGLLPSERTLTMKYPSLS